jgi:acyl-CoA synthetase (NDP forming)
MLEARSIALVGASPRPATFGQRMIEEVAKSPARPDIYLVNPRYREVGGRRCHPSLADLPGPVDLVLLAVPDAALEQQLTLAARRGDHSAVIFGNAHENPAGAGSWLNEKARYGVPIGTFMPARPPLRERLAAIARSAGLQVCGAGCMGFVNVARGLRAIGYSEPDPLPAGHVTLVTHSGSVFSAMLRARRGIGYTIAVSSGQELVTAAPSYLDYALGLPETLPPVDEETARQMIAELRIARLLAGVRGAPPADLGAVVRSITALSDLAVDLGSELAALDVNPLICGPSGATAVDVLAVTRPRPPG